MNINKIEDLENLKFTNQEEKNLLIRNLERRLIENRNLNMKIGNFEAKLVNKFYSNLIKFVELKKLTFDSEVILSEDMLNYLQDPEIVANKKIDEEKYLINARKYFSEKNKKLKGEFFVLENLDYLRNNLKIDLENFSMKHNFIESADFGKENPIDRNLLKKKIEYYEKNLNFLKELYYKAKMADLRNKDYVNKNKNKKLLKKRKLFEI